MTRMIQNCNLFAECTLSLTHSHNVLYQKKSTLLLATYHSLVRNNLFTCMHNGHVCWYMSHHQMFCCHYHMFLLKIKSVLVITYWHITYSVRMWRWRLRLSVTSIGELDTVERMKSAFFWIKNDWQSYICIKNTFVLRNFH